MMNEMFYTMCLRHHHLPSWTSFIDEYKEHWCYPIGIEQLSFKIPSSRFHYSFSERALDRKLINAYMSFLKEYYALHWFWNIGFTAPYWSLGNDKIGYDIVATNRFSHVFGIKIYSNTETARFFARVKAKSRNHLLRGSTSVSITSSFGANSIKLGDTYLFTDHILNAVYHYINDDICKDIIL